MHMALLTKRKIEFFPTYLHSNQLMGAKGEKHIRIFSRFFTTFFSSGIFLKLKFLQKTDFKKSLFRNFIQKF